MRMFGIFGSELQFDKEQWIKIRIWEATHSDGSVISSYSAAFNGAPGSNVGHASLETKNIYASFWPDQVTKVGTLEKNGAELLASPNDDVAAEGGDPTFVIVLYGLDVAALEGYFAEFKGKVDSGDRTWMEWGHHWFNKGQNCAGLVLELLQAGKVGRLTSFQDRKIVIPTPMDIRKLALNARRYQFSKHPETKNWSRDAGERIYEGAVPSKGVSCLMS